MYFEIDATLAPCYVALYKCNQARPHAEYFTMQIWCPRQASRTYLFSQSTVLPCRWGHFGFLCTLLKHKPLVMLVLCRLNMSFYLTGQCWISQHTSPHCTLNWPCQKEPEQRWFIIHVLMQKQTLKVPGEKPHTSSYGRTLSQVHLSNKTAGLERERELKCILAVNSETSRHVITMFGFTECDSEQCPHIQTNSGEMEPLWLSQQWSLESACFTFQMHTLKTATGQDTPGCLRHKN